MILNPERRDNFLGPTYVLSFKLSTFICYLWTQWWSVFTVNISSCYLAFAECDVTHWIMSVVESEGPRLQILSGSFYTFWDCVGLLWAVSRWICTFLFALGKNPAQMCSNGQITAERNLSVVCYTHITHMFTHVFILIQTCRSLCSCETVTSNFSHLETQVRLLSCLCF